jgi:TonB-dependent SusC/RagA subfamily outer membrane receptor
MKKILIIAVILISVVNSSVISAGNETVEGYIFDGKDAVPNVTVKSSANDRTAKTNKKGYFKMKGISSIKDTLFVKVAEEKTLEIPLEGTDQIIVRITGDTVFVQREKKEVVASSSYGGTFVTRSALEKSGETNLLRAIALKVPGVEYVDGNLLIRGIKSFKLSNFPLYILDGTETSQVSYLTVMEVESVEILKDASTSMFGVKGGNGVVIINRRK